MTSLITTDLVVLDADQGTESSAVIRALAATIAEQGRANSADGLADAAIAREEKTPTGVPGGHPDRRGDRDVTGDIRSTADR